MDDFTPSKFWQPFEQNIISFDELLEVVNEVVSKAVEHARQFAWRGQVNADWPLHSSLYRRLCVGAKQMPMEKQLDKEESDILVELHRWGLHSSAATGRLSVLRQLAMLQHYGAPTRLIDISFNAWVGVWFAVEEKWENGKLIHEDCDARLFAFDVTKRLINENDDYRRWEDDLSRPWKQDHESPLPSNLWSTSVFAWRPSNLDARIAAQNGGFLFGGVPSSSAMDGKKFQFPKSPNNGGFWKIEEGRKACCLAMRPHVLAPKKGLGADNGACYTFRISADAKKGIRDRLDKMFGYKHSTIYPDYSGFALFGTPKLKTQL